MKRSIPFLLIFLQLIISDIASSQAWTRISPTPQENQINQIIRIPGTLDIIAACEGSTILKSENLGNTWSIIVNPAGQPSDFGINGVYFLNSLTGFAYGEYETILKTNDGGLSWETVLTGSEDSYFKIRDMEFINDSTGFATKFGAGFYKTTDNGESWEPFETPMEYEYGLLEFLDQTEGVLVGIHIMESNYTRTTDAGITWIPENPAGLPLAWTIPSDVEFVNDSTGFVVVHEEPNLIYKSIDKGHNWFPCYSGIYTSGDLDFINDQQGIGVVRNMDSAKIIITNDCGATWQTVSLPGGLPLSCSYFDEQNAFAAGVKGAILRSQDSLQVWERLDEHIIPGDVMKTQFLNDSVGFLVYDLADAPDGMMKTTDSGHTWTHLTTPTPELSDFCFINEEIGFMAYSFDFYKTTDGGLTWTKHSSVFPNPAVAIEFYDETNGLVCTNDSPSYTHDGGETWTYVTPYNWYNGDLHDIEYLSPQEVLLSTGNYNSSYTLVYKSVNGGQTWVEALYGYDGNVNKIIHTQGDTLFLACNSIFRSVDRGSSWIDLNVKGLDKIKSLSFPSATTGYAVGTDAFHNILKTADGGITWEPDNLNCTSQLRDVHFFDNDHGLVFGDEGVEIETTIGGSVSTRPVRALSPDYFSIYPNPVSQFMRIAMDSKNLTSGCHISVCDLMGKHISSLSLNNSTETVFNVETLAPGVYLLRLINANSVVLQTRKMIKSASTTRYPQL